MGDDSTDTDGKPMDPTRDGIGVGKSDAFSPDDLIELVRAVKFTHTDMSIRKVHNEISVTMANSDPSYAFLKDVKFNDVKKVWRKALKGTKNESQEEGTTRQPEKTTDTPTAGMDTPNVPPDGNTQILHCRGWIREILSRKLFKTLRRSSRSGSQSRYKMKMSMIRGVKDTHTSF